MDRNSKLLLRARTAPAGIRFTELCRLAESMGWRCRAIRGSHHIFTRSGERVTLSFQNVDGHAKPYQVRQLIAWIDSQTGGTE